MCLCQYTNNKNASTRIKLLPSCFSIKIEVQTILLKLRVMGTEINLLIKNIPILLNLEVKN